MIDDRAEVIEHHLLKENKYFTSQIEDIRVGYECEIMDLMVLEDKWDKNILTDMDVEVIYTTGIQYVRVPYLTKEQIEADGWEFINHDKVIGIFEFKRMDGKDWYELSFYEGINTLIIDHWRHQDDDQQLFNGQCRCVNDLRLIMKILCIK